MAETTMASGRFPNAAGDYRCDEYLPAELTKAGITPVHQVEQGPGEVPYHWTGKLGEWKFRRAWYYWVCKGPPLPKEIAIPLHSLIGHEARLDGHCGCPSPEGTNWSTGHYHCDSQDGLTALAIAIRRAQKRKQS